MPLKLTTQAYSKMLLHAAKYPQCAVNGLLVAEKHKRKDGARDAALCVDCVPLFHGPLALAPMLEVALTLIDTWCKENKYVIAGYYQANERIKEARPNQVAERVASRISENFSEATMIMLDNSRFTMDCFVPVLLIYDHQDSKWKCREQSTSIISSCQVAASHSPLYHQDLAPAHSAKATSTWFKDHGIPVLNWPANSPDLNPIENLWGIVKRKMRYARPNNAEELKATIRATWALITPEQCHRLIDSMPRRIAAVIQAKGAPTKY
ncbi:ER membrane protein complex subunit 8 isoform X3 [Triplophysa rosa]|uniref:ER membrane protein complex subunit 8 isoform X3 n=1 Tax=Triplophysa rosa TaxID=992332 RepID=UPI002545E99B|nr:ER membrane protein complex subunit 8 isoform X3 [Triplophysa rosa]